ncbi:DUF6207 family protein [Streptomyces sp. PTD5-9]
MPPRSPPWRICAARDVGQPGVRLRFDLDMRQPFDA